MNFKRELLDHTITKILLIPYQTDEELEVVPIEGNFSESELVSSRMDEVYFTVETVYLEEESKPTDAGDQFTISFGFRFPKNSKRVALINRFRMLKNIRVMYCNGQFTDIGRNDFRQNKPVRGVFSTKDKFCMVEYNVTTIFPYQSQV